MILSIREILINIQNVSCIVAYLILLVAVGVWFCGYVSRQADKRMRDIDADARRTMDEYKKMKSDNSAQESD